MPFLHAGLPPPRRLHVSQLLYSGMRTQRDTIKKTDGVTPTSYDPYPGLQTLPTYGLSGPHQTTALPEHHLLPPHSHPKISTSLRRGSSTSDPYSPNTTSPLPHPLSPPNHFLLMTAALKDLTLKADHHWLVNLILQSTPASHDSQYYNTEGSSTGHYDQLVVRHENSGDVQQWSVFRDGHHDDGTRTAGILDSAAEDMPRFTQA